MTALQVFVEKWKSCDLCVLHKTRNRIVLGRGSIPCDVLFCAEAPGLSEDVIGQPMVGPAGHLLDTIIERAMEYSEDGMPRWTYALTNLVCCLPIDPETGAKAVEPEEEHVQACSERLKEFIAICNPKLIVCVGRLARDYAEPGMKHSLDLGYDGPRIDILHPAAILRMNVAGQGLAIQKCVVQISQAVSEHVLKGG